MLFPMARLFAGEQRVDVTIGPTAVGNLLPFFWGQILTRLGMSDKLQFVALPVERLFNHLRCFPNQCN